MAEAQQRALGYPDLPFVMLEHPVAVATDAEIEEKLEAAYAGVVAALTGGPAAGGAGARKQKREAAAPGPEWAEALSPVREMLRADGADLAVTLWENGVIHMKLVFSENVCEECILPKEELSRLILAACREAGHRVSEIFLQDPREPN